MRRQLKLLKFFVCVILILNNFSTISYSASNLNFSDVSEWDWFYQDLSSLVNRAVINGYTDGTFRPERSVSVAEFIKMSLVATNQKLIEPKGVFWYSQYVETAIAQGYISPTYFDDYQRSITRGEMGDIIDKILDLSYDNTQFYSGEITDYSSVASYHKASILDVYIAGIITGYTDGSIKTNAVATRSEAATVIVRMIDENRRKPPLVGIVSDSSSEELSSRSSEAPMANVSVAYDIQPVTKAFSVDGIEIGMSETYVIQHLGQPNERLLNQYNFEWFVYAGDYSSFKLIGIKDQVVVSFFSNVSFNSTLNLKIKTSDTILKSVLTVSEYTDYYYAIYDNMNIQFYSQKNVADGIEGILVNDPSTLLIANPSNESLLSMEKIIFHLTNGARKREGVSILSWSDQARISSFNHSKDMAIKNYFDHTDLAGNGPKERMQAETISANYFAENIAAGYSNPFEMHYALMHSPGHRKNILTDRFSHLGIGVYYLSTSKYRYYLTENFFEIR